MKAATLFSGGELAGRGMARSGCRMVWGLELDGDIAAHARSQGHPVRTGDVLTADPSEFEKVDILHASPPCQNASVAKSGGGETDRDRDMARAVVRFIGHHRPKVFTLENVWGYRNFDSFRLILQALHGCGYAFDYEHINMADYGVPQTRKRLILWARLDTRRFPAPPSTHAVHPRGTGLFGSQRQPWNSWYGAIEDLLPLCPDSQLAPWQEARMPEEIRTMLVHGQADNERFVIRSRDAPAFTTLTGNLPRAVLVDSTNAGRDVTALRTEKQGFSVTSNHHKGLPRAVMISSQSIDGEAPALRHGEAPALTTGTNAARVRAVIVDGQDKNLGLRDGGRRSTTVTGTSYKGMPKAILGVRVVQLTPRCLARFQTLGDDYALPESRRLACIIIGNGVPSLFMKKLYAHHIQ